jgi:L-asparagine transporter-like permease
MDSVVVFWYTLPMPPAAAPDHESGLRRQLTAGQMAMVAVGGSIGTGLFLGSGAAVKIAGPGVILSYAAAAVLTWLVAMALGEMASRHPAAGSFGVYAEHYLNPWAGFVARYGYWFAVFTALGAQLVAAATYSSFWLPDVPRVAWIAVYAALLLAVNFRTVGDFGAFEYWFAMLKLAAVAAFIVTGAGLLLGGRVAAQYATQGFLPNGGLSPLFALSFALFSFLGVEMVAISSGEARTATDIPRATHLSFALLALVYLGATAVLVGVVPWHQAGVTQSPFVTVFEVAGLPAASAVMNFIVLTAALSGANANLYVASRMLFSLGRTGYAPEAMGRLTATGAPRNAVIVSSFGVLLALGMQYWAPQQAYLAILGASLFGGMLAWWVALASHIAFRRRATAEELAAMPMRAPLGAAGSVVAFVGVLVAILATWWVPESRITITSGVPYLLVMSVAYWAVRARKKT